MAAKKREKKKLSFPLRLLIVVIILGTIFGSVAILANSGDSLDAPTTDPNSSVNDTSTNDNESTSDSVIVDNDAITVSFISAKDASTLGVFYVTLKIENKTESVIMVNLENASVDGETIPLITTGVPLVIQPGNSGQTGFIFSMVNLSISSMDEAEQATFQVVVRDNDSLSEISRSEMVTIELH